MHFVIRRERGGILGGDRARIRAEPSGGHEADCGGNGCCRNEIEECRLMAPWSPPRNLVVVGLYRYSRNPMYISVILILLGWALGFRTASLWIYALLMMLGFHLRVVFGEEPWLAR